ncbi:MAG: hypothetical protein DRP15_04260, partial [Candidatus Aenigmatarchaeota archaeon]
EYDNMMQYQVYVDDNRINCAPVVSEIPDISIRAGKELVVTVNASDPDGDAIEYSINDGRFVQDGNTFHWVPGEADTGTFNVEVSASDGELSGSKTFEVKVEPENRAPQINMQPKYSVGEGETLSIPIIASDEDGDHLEYYVNGTILPGNVFSWKPGYNDAGTHSFLIKVSDSLDTTEKLITVNVFERETPTRIYVDPEVKKIGKKRPRTVNIRIDTTEPVYSVQFNVSYNESVLQLTDINEGEFLYQGSGDVFSVLELGNGTISYAATRFDTTENVNGSGILVTLEFNATEDGMSSIDISDVHVLDYKSLRKIITRTAV